MIFISILFSLIILGLFLFMILYPKEFYFWGKSWEFKNKSFEEHEKNIKSIRMGGIIALVIFLAIFVSGFLYRNDERRDYKSHHRYYDLAPHINKIKG